MKDDVGGDATRPVPPVVKVVTPKDKVDWTPVGVTFVDAMPLHSLAAKHGDLIPLDVQPTTYNLNGDVQYWFTSPYSYAVSSTASTATPMMPPRGGIPVVAVPESGYHLESEHIEFTTILTHQSKAGGHAFALPPTAAAGKARTEKPPREPHPHLIQSPAERIDMLLAAVFAGYVFVRAVCRVRARLNGLHGGRAEGEGPAHSRTLAHASSRSGSAYELSRSANVLEDPTVLDPLSLPLLPRDAHQIRGEGLVGCLPRLGFCS